MDESIDKSPQQAIELLKEIKLFIDGNSEGKDGDLIYKIRNSIVHFRPANKQIKLNDEHWDKLIRASLLVIEDWYKKYDAQLSNINYT
ncbi:hypothetical protein [Mastigocoleus sp. MO_188.B34]|uniref:hypothetical protein n=1 Tax=Mastigocoleus sp. MO_188.B34 TaxID=3036635 RepID=UPI002636B78C|nr:hypothetical protein [Mastigocoleus sp. MO_188.B34]MDJ0697906.1 hypothetical protein [Mastigocoleus sp. MO_188.B34]